MTRTWGIVTWCAILWMAIAAPRADSLRPGFAGLYKSASLVVVYPSLPTELAAVHRRSAEQRAVLLREVHGIQARVVADGDVTAGDLGENLLVLGWDNRVLGSDRAPRPFERSASSLNFLGLEAPAEGHDLAFRTASPFAPDRMVAFWSRIDPELDRMQPLPSFGSDWALYREFLPVAQGMFESLAAWPPVRNVDAERDRREELGAIRVGRAKVAAGSVSVVFDPAAILESEARAILEARRGALDAARRALGVTPERLDVRVEVYEDEKAKDDLTGVPSPAHSISRDGVLHVVRRAATSTGFHEEIHLVAERAFGGTTSTALYEGLAVAAEGSYRGRDLAMHAAILLEADRVPPIADLLDEGALRSLPDDDAVPAAALVVRFVRDRGGDAGVRRAYVASPPDVRAVGDAAGVPPDRLDGAFRTWLSGLASAKNSEVQFLKLMAEAQRAHADSDYAELTRILRAALELRPNEPQTLFNLAAAEMRLGEYDAAERELRTLLTTGLADEHDLVVFSYLQLGRLDDLRGRRDSAVANYREVLERGDRHDSHLSAQEGIERPFTADRLQ